MPDITRRDWGLIRRDRILYWLVLWVALGLFLSQPVFLNDFMDPVSTVISFYIPVAIAIGWMVAQISKPGIRLPYFGKALLFICAAGFTVLSVPLMRVNYRSGMSYVQPDDLPALDWIREKTPQSAYFMVNLFHFPFSPDLIIATDAGYWLPLLTGRKTVSLPMTYMSEKFHNQEGIDVLKKLDALNGHLCTPEAVQLLAEQGITHVYLGSVGKVIPAEELVNCPNFKPVYQFNDTYIFQFIPR